MKTVAEVMYEISVAVDDEGMTRFKPEVLRRFIYAGEKEVARRTECLRYTANIAVGAAVQTVTGPTDAVRLTQCLYLPTGSSAVYPLEYRDQQSLSMEWGPWQAIDQSAYPSFWTTWGAPPTLTIGLYPIPSEAGVLRVFYYRLPANINPNGTDDTDAIDLPEGWEECLVDYGEAMCFRKDRDLDGYQIAYSQFESKMGALLETSVRYTDQAGQIDFAGWGSGYGGGDFW